MSIREPDRLVALGKAGLVLSVCLIALVASGCTAFVARGMVKPPNRGHGVADVEATDQLGRTIVGVEHVERVTVGPPSASIACWVLDPAADPPRGTVFVLHGFGDGPFWMAEHARAVVDHGYRAILVAFRGYAGSTGNERTFGVLERRDLAQVLDALTDRGVAVGPVGVWGVSYGGATALQWAAHDPRVEAVVAIAGFSSIRTVAPSVIRTFMPIYDWFVDDAGYNRMIDEAGEVAGFDPDETDVCDAVLRSHAAILVVHGTDDAIVPFSESDRIIGHVDPSNERVHRVVLEGEGHFGVWLDLDGRVRAEGVAWLDRWLSPVAMGVLSPTE